MSLEDREITALRQLKLTDYEARLYLSLLKRGLPLKASELSFFGQVPRTKAYGAIKELERKGLLRIIPGKPELYEACSPNEALFPMVSKMNNEMKACEDVVQSLAVTFEATKYMKRDGSPKQSDEFWRMDGRQAIYNKLGQVMSEASKSINYCTSEIGLIRAYKAHAEPIERARKNGANIKLLAPITTSNRTVAKEIAEIVELKATARPITHFVSVDCKHLIVLESMPEDADTRAGHDVAIWTTNTLLIELFEHLFDEVWRSTPTFPMKEVVVR